MDKLCFEHVEIFDRMGAIMKYALLIKFKSFYLLKLNRAAYHILYLNYKNRIILH